MKKFVQKKKIVGFCKEETANNLYSWVKKDAKKTLWF